jgi:hypothetical protein
MSVSITTIYNNKKWMMYCIYYIYKEHVEAYIQYKRMCMRANSIQRVCVKHVCCWKEWKEIGNAAAYRESPRAKLLVILPLSTALISAASMIVRSQQLRHISSHFVICRPLANIKSKFRLSIRNINSKAQLHVDRAIFIKNSWKIKQSNII